ncbi:MAG: prephenate dehydrogenase/arogenate dehydrogenase family protein [Bacteroidetes bacterium]|nr:prephenate dehydrogenase/arogenate dehydrogenase family protein [Bacteroidota bacterium]
MSIRNVSIVGLGLMGGSIAKALKNSEADIQISAFDKEDILKRAMEDGVIDSPLDNIECVLASDLIFLCTPVDASISIFNSIAGKLSPNTILTDVCGVKFPLQKIWDAKGKTGKYIGGHPMTGKEVGGYENSDPLLFENCVYILSEDLNQNEELSEFRKIIELLGANILFVPPKQHDLIAASVSHLPQLVSVALVNTAALKTDYYNFLDLAAGGFRDMTRIASSDFKIWEPVIRENKKEIITAIEKFQFELDKLKNSISENKTEEIEKYFDLARTRRDEIPKNTKGFLKPLHDLYIFVKDEPGVISRVSTTLAKENLNIKDIELLKIREGSGGTFRIAFESADDAASAHKCLRNAGFKTK